MGAGCFDFAMTSQRTVEQEVVQTREYNEGMSANVKKAMKYVGLLILLLLFVALGLLIWIQAEDAKNASAVQAVTSYVLVLVTSVYVLLTYGLVLNQRRQARYEIETRALMELGRLLHEAKRFMVPSLERIFPIRGQGHKPNIETLSRPDKQLLDLYWDLNRLTPDLPNEVRKKADETWQAVWMASSDTINLLWAFRNEEAAAEEEGRDWSWAGAARFYREEHEVGKTREAGFWNKMLQGVRVEKALKALQDLDKHVTKARSQ